MVSILDAVKSQVSNLTPEQIREHLKKIKDTKEKAKAYADKVKARDKEKREEQKLFIQELLARAQAEGITLESLQRPRK